MTRIGSGSIDRTGSQARPEGRPVPARYDGGVPAASGRDTDPAASGRCSARFTRRRRRSGRRCVPRARCGTRARQFLWCPRHRSPIWLDRKKGATSTTTFTNGYQDFVGSQRLRIWYSPADGSAVGQRRVRQQMGAGTRIGHLLIALGERGQPGGLPTRRHDVAALHRRQGVPLAGSPDAGRLRGWRPACPLPARPRLRGDRIVRAWIGQISLLRTGLIWPDWVGGKSHLTFGQLVTYLKIQQPASSPLIM